MSHLKISVFIVMIAFGNQINLQAGAADTEASNGDEIKRIDMPFIHIGVRKHSNGEKDVDVKAPFVNVHNPAGADNAQVKAPFTKINHSASNSSTQQPIATSKTKVTKEKKTVVEKTTQ